jgi:hypothetical protein
MKTLAECAAPAQATKKLLEKDVQSKCVEWMRGRGYWARKFSSMTQRSVPDYLFARAADYTYQDIKLAVEFKAPGKSSTDAQRDEQEAMRQAGWFVLADVSDVKKFQRDVLAYETAMRKWG